MSPLILLIAITVGTVDAPDTLVICPNDFRPALQPWVEYRQKQGHTILVQPPAATSYEIRRQVKRVAKSGQLKNVVIIGDAGDARVRRQYMVPTDYVLAKVNVLFGSTPEISTDNTYADINDDGILDLTIGRIPVDSAAELTRYIDRVMEYESLDNVGAWRRKINFVAGVGGFGGFIDKLIEQSAKQIITDLVPPEYKTSMTYGSWTSPYCPDPRRFSETAIGRFNEGCMFWVYIGHGSKDALDRVMLPDGRYDILNLQSAQQISAHSGSPIAIFLACHTGASDDECDCLTEELLRLQRGPIAVISSSRVSMPYAMSVMSLEMMDGFFNQKIETLGELVLYAKQNMMAQPKLADPYRALVELMGLAFSPKPELLAEERKEHVYLMHLFGDPLLRLQRPAKIELDSPAVSVAGDRITVKGNASADGQLVIDICYKRDRYRKRPPRRKEYDSSPATFAHYQLIYNQIQQLVCTEKTIDVKAGEFEVQLDVPPDASGDCFVRAMLLADETFALGSTKIFVNAR